MMTFKGYRINSLGQSKLHNIDERLLRPAAILALAAKSRGNANRAEMEFKKGLEASKGIHKGMQPDDIPIRIAQVLKYLLRGALYRRRQTGDHIAIDTLGHIATKKKR